MHDDVAQAVWERIRAAFAGTPRPSPPLTEGGGALADDVDDMLAGHTADSLDATTAHRIRFDLWLLTPKAYRSFLPGLLRHVIVPDRHVDGLGEALFGTLVPPAEPELRAVFDARMAGLTPRQRDAVGAFVHWYLEREEFAPRRELANEFWPR